MKHKHHIIPKHMGGDDHPDNIIELSIEEHAIEHKKLWELHNKIEDYIAWKCLSGKSEECEKERIELSKKGFNNFLESEKKCNWRQNISNSLKGKKQSTESKIKKSESLKKSYESGKRDTWFKTAPKEFFQENYAKNKHLLDQGRKNSKKWKESVTSEEYRLKKSKFNPKSQKITIDGKTYHSIRNAAKELNIPYNSVRKLLQNKISPL